MKLVGQEWKIVDDRNSGNFSFQELCTEIFKSFKICVAVR